uniref:Putative lipocalin-5 1 n=1 Tax=Amblyomma triste TaxID=251400 RepID=A0A023G9C4_AMBTT
MMRTVICISVVSVMLVCAMAGEKIDRGPHEQQREIPSIAEVVALFRDSIALMDIDNDSILDCLTARRIQYDPDVWSATYLWNVAASNGERLHFPVYLTAADTPDNFNISTSIKPGQFFIGHTYYFDGESCVVISMPHLGNQCTLWVTKERKDSIPDECMEQFEKNCGNGNNLHDRDTCKDVDTTAFPDSTDNA